MDFFDRQDKARRNTKLLVFYFVAAVALLICAIYFAVLLIFVGVKAKTGSGGVGLWDPEIFFGVAVGTLAVVLFGSLFKTMALSRGGSAVATMLGGRLLNPDSTDLDERKLLNVVEEMALASGVPVPQVYVMDQEKGINAFAAGHSTSDAVIGVTRGCMKLLSRDELQGVIAHEFSHILNGDMRLNLRLMGLIFGILCIAVIGRILLHTSSRAYRLGARNRGGNPLPLLGLALLLIGGVGVFFGRLIQAAVSRQREFLADAAAVQFTRNPDGLGGALKKIGGLVYGSKLEATHAEEASHLFFGNGLGKSFMGLMATHPPLKERIRAIDPGFDGKFPRVALRELDEPAVPEPAGSRPPPFPFPFPGPQRSQTQPGLAGLMPPVIAAQAVLPDLGSPGAAHLQYAAGLRDSIPGRVQEAAHDPLGASAVVFALLLSSDPALREQQLQLLATSTSIGVRQETERVLPDVSPIATRARLPLVDLALPALRNLSPEQYRRFREAVVRVIESDREVDLFEYVLQKIVLRHLDPHFGEARKPVIQYYALRPLAGDCAVLLSALAHVGHDDPGEAASAFRRGAQQLNYQAQAELEFVPAAHCDLPQVDAALARLSQAAPQIKKNVLTGCIHTVAADGVIKEIEAELLRGIADTLDCPIPPFVQPQ